MKILIPIITFLFLSQTLWAGRYPVSYANFEKLLLSNNLGRRVIRAMMSGKKITVKNFDPSKVSPAMREKYYRKFIDGLERVEADHPELVDSIVTTIDNFGQLEGPRMNSAIRRSLYTGLRTLGLNRSEGRTSAIEFLENRGEGRRGEDVIRSIEQDESTPALYHDSEGRGWLTAQEAADQLDISKSALYKRILDGEAIPYYRTEDGELLFSRKDLAEYLDNGSHSTVSLEQIIQ